MLQVSSHGLKLHMHTLNTCELSEELSTLSLVSGDIIYYTNVRGGGGGARAIFTSTPVANVIMASKAEVPVPTSSYPALKLSGIVYIPKPLEDKYHKLGVQLDVPVDQLKLIELHYSGVSRRFSEMIGLWLNTSETDCSWSVLADAIEKVRRHDRLMRELRAMDDYFTGNQCPNRGYLESSEDTGYSTKNELASGDCSGSEIDHFDEIPGCG